MEETNDILSKTVREFTAAVADKTPTPGGGSVAGVVGALAVALGEMTLNFTRGKKKFAAYEQAHAHMAGRLERSRRLFLELVSDDIAAYSLYRDAAAMSDGPAKIEAMQLALAAAINVPMEMSKLTLAAMQDMLDLSDNCNTYLISDLVAAATLGLATVQLCDYNVRINAPQLADQAAATELRQVSASGVTRAREMQAAIEKIAAPQLG
ncbi:MAG: hypothetical protein EHM48_01485 [Planctomycetaceae bacterium]|nr:MAG: hypothetical protein EHM48_01485 [Planctomycetaceae bacterium]